MWKKLRSFDDYQIFLCCAVFVTIVFSIMGYRMGVGGYVRYYGWCFDDAVVSQVIMVVFAASFMMLPVLLDRMGFFHTKK